MIIIDLNMNAMNGDVATKKVIFINLDKEINQK